MDTGTFIAILVMALAGGSAVWCAVRHAEEQRQAARVDWRYE